MKTDKSFRRLAKKIRKDVILAPLTTFNIGGPADYFVEADTEKEIIEAVTWAKEKNLKYYILGAGSNVLIADKGIRGMVIKIKSPSYATSFAPPSLEWLRRPSKASEVKKATEGKQKFRPKDDQPLAEKMKNNNIMVEAGVLLSQLIQYSVDHSLSGLECLAGIPGTVGGAVFSNAGAKNGSISRVIEKVTILNNNGQSVNLSKSDCGFDYRTSRFQTSKEIILNATFKLKKEKPEIIIGKIKSILSRRKNQPVGFSAGSIFKNPCLATAGYLIENAGLKGKTVGDAYISTKHANWIINKNKARAQDVIKLISMIKAKVQTDFKVKLKEEIIILGEQ